MQKISQLARMIALTLLSGGSAAAVFAAIVLVHAAKAKGVPVAEAAANNAPIFIQYSKVALGAAVVLAMTELIELPRLGQKSKVDTWIFGSCLACTLFVAAFSLGIVPQMEHLLPDIKTVSEAHEQFQKLHHYSQGIFGASILFAYICLAIPIFKSDNSEKSSPEKG